MANAATLKPGDVLLFTPDDSHVDKIICLLTESDVAHSALFYGKDVNGKDILVDAATGTGIAGHQMQVLPPGQAAPRGETPPPPGPWFQREIYVRRHPTPPPLDGVLDSAKSYAHENNGFNFMGLIALGLHLLFRMDPRPGTVEKLLVELLRMLTGELSQLIPRPTTGAKGPHPMYCSQFVFQCFSKGGCKLDIDSGRQRLIPSTTMLDWIASNSIPLATLRAEAAKARSLAPRSVDAIVADLLTTLSSDVGPPASLAAAGSRNPSQDLILATMEFGQALQRVQEARGPMNLGTGLPFLKTLQGQYVTPADLKDHCGSLTPIGQKVLISRNQNPYPI